MRKYVFALAVSLGALSPALAADIKFGNWNIQTLTYPGDPKTVFPDDYQRVPQDYTDLQKWRDLVGADVYFLQEVTSPAAIDAVFPSSQGWTHCISGQYAKDNGEDIHPVCTAPGGTAEKPKVDTRTQYTAVAVRKGSPATILSATDVPSLDVPTKTADGVRSVRWGLDVAMAVGQKKLRVLVVHMKSGCFDDYLNSHDYLENPVGKTPSSTSCVVLGRQLFPLRAWIEARQSEAAAWMIVGDFNRRLDAGAGIFQDEVWSALSGYAPRRDASTGKFIDTDGRNDIQLFREPYKEASVCWQEMKQRFPASLADQDEYNLLPIEFFLFGENLKALLNSETLRQITWPTPQVSDMTRLSDHCPKSLQVSVD